jgi:hypothetical protein
MQSGSQTYAELNEHHTTLEEERQKDRILQPNQEAEEATQLAEQRRRADIVAWRDQVWRLEFGDDAVRRPEYVAAEQRILAKGSVCEAQDLNDLYQSEKHLEQVRQVRLQHEAAQANQSENQSRQRER